MLLGAKGCAVVFLKRYQGWPQGYSDPVLACLVPQVMDLEGLSHDAASQRVTGGMQAVLDQLPASSTTVWITQLACVPGCVLMLADVAVGEGEQYGEEEDEEVLGESEGEIEGGFEVAGGAYMQEHQQRPGAAFHEGTWQIDVSQRSANNALCFLAFMSISSFGAAVGDGSLLNAFAAVLSRASAQEASDVAQAAASGADPLVVSSWGGILQLAVQLPECQEQQQHTAQGPSSSSAGRDGSSSSKVVRLVLVQGQRVLIDQEILTDVSGMTLSLLLRLPPFTASVCESYSTAAALYVLPAESVLEGHRSSSSSSSSSGASAAVAAVAGPLAHLTLLLLPPAAAAELLLWVEQLQLSQLQLQPLLEDMAVAVEACGIAAGSAAAAGVGSAAAAAGPAEAVVGSPAAAQLPSNSTFVWSQAAAAARRVLSIAHAWPQLRLCEDMMAVCCQQLLVALRRSQPLAAGGLPSAEEASQLRLASAAAGLGVTGANGSLSTSAAGEGSGPKPDEEMAKEGSGVCEALPTGKLDLMDGATPPTEAAEHDSQLVLAASAAAGSGAGGAVSASDPHTLLAEGRCEPERAPYQQQQRPGPTQEQRCSAGSVSTSYLASAKDALLGLEPGGGTAGEKEGGAKVPVSPAVWEGSLVGKSLGKRHELGTRSTGVNPAAAAAGMSSKVWLWWCCVLGSLLGWRDRELEAGYLAVRMQQGRGSRPPTWIAMGVIYVFMYGVMVVRAAYYAYSSLSTPHVVRIFWYYLAQSALVYTAYGLWLLLCPPSQWCLTGWVACTVECVRIIGLEGYRCFNGGFETFYLLARKATSNACPILVACLMTVRIVLHQLPPPWLLLHAAAMVCWLWRLQVNLPGWWPSASSDNKEAWLQPLMFAAAGIAAVVSQEAGSRAAYIKSLQRRQ